MDALINKNNCSQSWPYLEDISLWHVLISKDTKLLLLWIIQTASKLGGHPPSPTYFYLTPNFFDNTSQNFCV